MISHERDQYQLSFILYEFSFVFFNRNQSTRFGFEHDISEEKNWS